jgi:hypothetical protein
MPSELRVSVSSQRVAVLADLVGRGELGEHSDEVLLVAGDDGGAAVRLGQGEIGVDGRGRARRVLVRGRVLER